MEWHYPDDGDYPRVDFETDDVREYSVDVVAINEDGFAYIAYYSIGDVSFWADVHTEQKLNYVAKWCYLPEDYYEDFLDMNDVNAELRRAKEWFFMRQAVLDSQAVMGLNASECMEMDAIDVALNLINMQLEGCGNE